MAVVDRVWPACPVLILYRDEPDAEIICSWSGVVRWVPAEEADDGWDAEAAALAPGAEACWRREHTAET